MFMKLGAKELRKSEPTEEEIKNLPHNSIFLILDDVLDTYNIGALFRLADAAAAEKIYLCGQTEAPPNHKIMKASVGTYKWVPWEKVSTVVDAIKEVKKEKPETMVVAIEQDPKSISYTKLSPTLPLALIVGNETTGVSKEAREQADAIVELPMFGVNRSLNVMVTCGIVLYTLVAKLNLPAK